MSAGPIPSTSISQASKRQERHAAAREEEHRQQRQAEEQANQAELKQASHHQAAIIQPTEVLSPHKEIAEYIVQEEREARSKLPIYPGLEDFELIEKMGEYVLFVTPCRRHANHPS